MQVQLTTNERQQLLAVLREMDPAALAAPTEKRHKPRRKVAQKLWLRRIAQDEQFPIQQATLVNTSQTGVGLLCPQRLPQGERFVIPLRFVEGGGWLVLCEVRNCRRLSESHFKVGAKFIDKIEDHSGTARPPGDWTV
ncbi:MAG TPA: PilZ domain-containing protein [Phycisphaerae bacterium]|nr:PilZ domain-containing protein [Phycisphaerae bacterium]